MPTVDGGVAFEARGPGPGGAMGVAGCGAEALGVGVPHFEQKAASGGSAVPHFTQNCPAIPVPCDSPG